MCYTLKWNDRKWFNCRLLSYLEINLYESLFFSAQKLNFFWKVIRLFYNKITLFCHTAWRRAAPSGQCKRHPRWLPVIPAPSSTSAPGVTQRCPAHPAVIPHHVQPGPFQPPSHPPQLPPGPDQPVRPEQHTPTGRTQLPTDTEGLQEGSVSVYGWYSWKVTNSGI